MLQNSRALRRASDIASACAVVTGRRPMTILGIVAGVVLGASVTVGAVSIPAAGLADAAAAVLARMTAASAPIASGAMPLTAIADEATQVFDEAKGVVTAAEALSAEVVGSGLEVDPERVALDASTVKEHIGVFEDRKLIPALLPPPLTSGVASATSALVADTAALREGFTAAQEKKAAEDAAREAAEEVALASGNTVDRVKKTARELAASRYAWGAEQFSCLNSLWTKESGWNCRAYNPSGATGIPQALPGDKMASTGDD